ncbi:MAG TPA: hypothetical protein VG028_15590 [Terriglobia bacterium]|nr:hypothetical protein [Terriglobia bacterium]
MTYEEMQQSMKDLRDNQLVQGQILHRVETNLDHLGEKLGRLEGVVEKLADGQVLLTSAMRGLVATVEGLSATVDRFIRVMEGNGHHPAGTQGK